MRGVAIYLYRSDLRDCTNGGISSPSRSKGKTFVVFDEAFSAGDYLLENVRNNPNIVCLKVVRRNIGGPIPISWRTCEPADRPGMSEYLHLEPMFDRPEGKAGPMFGGNYAIGDGLFKMRHFTFDP